MQARIYRPSKTAMQSGRANTDKWVLELEPTTRREPEPLMGWTSCGDTTNQVRLSFETKEEAVAYARRRGLVYSIEEPKPRAIRPRAYADNFSFKRTTNWTH